MKLKLMVFMLYSFIALLLSGCSSSGESIDTSTGSVSDIIDEPLEPAGSDTIQPR